MKSFSKWTVEEIELEFGLYSERNTDGLREWLTVDKEINEADRSRLQSLSHKLLARVHDWNEEELKIYFISHLLDMVDFDQGHYRPFLERDLAVEYEDGKELSGTIDFVVAQGKQSPRNPYFLIKEYKRQQDSSKDPLGQLLAELMAAQFLNGEQQQPIYGAYIVGRYWYFVLLDGKVYSESLSYDATKEDIFDIYHILDKVRSLIDKLVMQA
ncbi:MAG: hypothetical protein AAF702_16190 [Chloroflexota bacterium]